jgi:hypothetical protein
MLLSVSQLCEQADTRNSVCQIWSRQLRCHVAPCRRLLPYY